MSPLILLILSLPAFSSTTSEGFIRPAKDGFRLEKGLDRSVLPNTSACAHKGLEKYKNHYVKLEWTYSSDQKCFEIVSIKRIIYDPLKGTTQRGKP